ncbi:DUF1905 domain-containing protein [Demequina sp. NBRC 110056]|uniref:DUF1905 domain-containing protein n=1 Tax=Demequina sp. NBRC 110056 TaxID=1570345 RepID=UPI0009FF90F5|nr:DUF1905 domain-containing protein [Demequina sp. NBRC 110056]
MTAYAFDAELWNWTGEGAQWVFLTVPEDVADEVEAAQTGPERGFGAVKVEVVIGSSTWRTSMFPSKEHASYILPIKASVRRSEGITAGDTATVAITLVAP